uniref:CSON005895 protein n=1 Tax=Culicoides sonorensis TaxID=179676 RepID=A0A336MWE6_CULSO
MGKISLIFCLFALSILVSIRLGYADETPGFFLKVTRPSVPRIGRSGNDFENFFLKQSKSVPRIGRRNQFVDQSFPEEQTPAAWYDRLLLPSKRQSPLNNYNNVLPFDDTFLNALTDDLLPLDAPLKFVSWNDLDLALENDSQLREKLINVAQEKQLDELLHLVSPKRRNEIFNKFLWIPGPQTDHQGNSLQEMFYRIDRGQSKETSAEMKKRNSGEKLEYNYQNN